MDPFLDRAIRYEIAARSDYLPPIFRPLSNGKKLYLEKIRKLQPPFELSVEDFARQHLGDKFNGNLSRFAAFTRRNPIMYSRENIAPSIESQFSITNTRGLAPGLLAQRYAASQAPSSWGCFQLKATFASSGSPQSNSVSSSHQRTPLKIPNDACNGQDFVVKKPKKALCPVEAAKKILYLGDGIGMVVVEMQSDISKWDSLVESPGLLTSEGKAVGVKSYVPRKATEEFHFSAVFAKILENEHIPDEKYLKPLNVPINNIRPHILQADKIAFFLRGLNPSSPDPPMEDIFFYPPTRRCDPVTVVQLATKQQAASTYPLASILHRPGKPVQVPSVIRVDSSTFGSKYNHPKDHNGNKVVFPRLGLSWLDSAWEYDIFPIYKKNVGLYWDFRGAFQADE
ncbi:hypothetical protein RUND412_009816 [Rhizina undulata]